MAHKVLFEGWLTKTKWWHVSEEEWRVLENGRGFETTRYVDPEDPYKTWVDPDEERKLQAAIDSGAHPMFEGMVQNCFDDGADDVRVAVADVYAVLQPTYGAMMYTTIIDGQGAYSPFPQI